MAKYTFTVQEMLRSASDYQGGDKFFQVPDPDELISQTFDKFFNFNAIDYWTVFNNSNKQKQQQDIDDAQAVVNNLIEDSAKINSYVVAKRAELERAKAFVTADTTKDFANATNGKVEAIQADLDALVAQQDYITIQLQNADDILDTAKKTMQASDDAVAAANQKSLEEFEKTFLEKYFTAESKYETPGLMKLQLKSWWRANMPLYSQLLNKQQTDIFITNYSLDQSSANSTTNSNDKNTGTNWGAGDSVNTSNQDTLTGTADTPQDRLDLDVHDLKYASQVGRTNTDTTANNHDANVNHSTNISDGQNTTNTANNGTTQSRNQDIFGIIAEWTSSNYSIYLDIFDKLDSLLFLQLF